MTTMRDVARLAGVSAKTVSRVLRGDDYVSDDVRARVVAAVGELQYVRNSLAVSFRTGRDLAVGVAVPDLANPFFAEIVQAVETVVRERRAAVIVTSTSEDGALEQEAIEALLRRQVMGLIAVPVAPDQSYLRAWQSRVPMVFVDRAPGQLTADAVLQDDAGGAVEAARHLLDRGHRRIALVAETLDTVTVAVRAGSSALVLGAGPTGLLIAQLLRSGGAASVTVAAPTAFKLATARNLGIDNTVLIDRNDMPGNLAALRRASGADGYDYVIEATGSPSIGQICVPLTRRGGTVLIYGVTGTEAQVSFNPFDVFRREITIKGSFAEMTSFGAAIHALRSGRVRTDGIITHRFGLGDYGKAIEALAGDKSAHKVVITV